MLAFLFTILMAGSNIPSSSLVRPICLIVQAGSFDLVACGTHTGPNAAGGSAGTRLLGHIRDKTIKIEGPTQKPPELEDCRVSRIPMNPRNDATV